MAVWDEKGSEGRKPEEQAKRAGGAIARPGFQDGGLVAALGALRGRLVRRAPSLEEVFLLILGLSMAGFAIDWALRILGLK